MCYDKSLNLIVALLILQRKAMDGTYFGICKESDVGKDNNLYRLLCLSNKTCIAAISILK